MTEERKKGILHSRRVGNVVVLVLLLIAGYYFAFRGMRFFRVPSESMVPTLLVGDQLMTLRQPEYHRGDIVVFRDTNDEYLVKRIAGVGGDSILITEGSLFINEAFVSEPYIKEPMIYTVVPPVLVPPSEFFMLGDNRNNSEDSSIDRHTVPLAKVVGKVMFRYYPYDRWGRVPSYPMETVDEY